MEALPWVKDGTDYTEASMIGKLTSMAETSPRVFEIVMKTSWIRIERGKENGVDDLVVWYLMQMAATDEAIAVQVMDLPFMDTMDWEDSTRVRFLLELMTTDRPGLERLLIHPELLARPEKEHPAPMALLYLDTRDSDAARQIANLPWVRDGTPELENEAVVLLQELALKSPTVFQVVIGHEPGWLPPQTGTDTSAMERIISLSEVNEYVALRVIEMPFMDSISYQDYELLRFLLELAQSDVAGLDFVLSHPDFAGGLADEQVNQVALVYLERTDPDAARLIRNLRWVADGIAYWPESDSSSIHDDMSKFESGAVSQLIGLSQWNPQVFLGLVNKPWLQEELTRSSYEVFDGLTGLSGRLPGATIKLLEMPFLDEVDINDDITLETLNDLYWEDADKVTQLVNRLEAMGGLTDDNHFLVKYFQLELVNPQAWHEMNDLSWVRDGLQESEQPGVRELIYTALYTNGLFPELLDKHWVKDGISTFEAALIQELRSTKNRFDRRDAGGEVVLLLDMPFLESVEPSDTSAVSSLSRLAREGEGDTDYLAQVLSHPELKGGITDQDAMIIAFLGRLARQDPGLMDELLSSGGEWLAHRDISLPHTGTIRLAVLEEDAGRERTLDLLEHTVRTHEEFMMTSYPADFMGILAAEIPGGLGGGVIPVRPTESERPFRISSSAAFAYWPLYHPPWMSTGAVYVLTWATTPGAFGKEPSPETIRCGPIRNLGQLEHLSNQSSDERDGSVNVPSSCSYDMGIAFYLDLYSQLGDRAFRQGFRQLYLEARKPSHDQTCYDPERGLCLVRKSFVDSASPSKAAVAAKIIEKWYYGDPLGKEEG